MRPSGVLVRYTTVLRVEETLSPPCHPICDHCRGSQRFGQRDQGIDRQQRPVQAREARQIGLSCEHDGTFSAQLSAGRDQASGL